MFIMTAESSLMLCINNVCMCLRSLNRRKREGKRRDESTTKERARIWCPPDGSTVVNCIDSGAWPRERRRVDYVRVACVCIHASGGGVG